MYGQTVHLKGRSDQAFVSKSIVKHKTTLTKKRVRPLIDPILLLQQTVNFLLLLLLLNHLLYKPVRKFLDERTLAIENKISEANQEKERALEMRRELEAQLADAKSQAREILDNASKRSEQVHEELIAKAKEETKQMQERAGESLRLEKEKAWADLKNNVIQLSFSIASKVVKESLDEKKHQELIDQTISQLDQQELGGRL